MRKRRVGSWILARWVLGLVQAGRLELRLDLGDGLVLTLVRG